MNDPIKIKRPGFETETTDSNHMNKQVDTTTETVFHDLNTHREIQYKNAKVDKYNRDDKFCMIVPSTSSAFAVLQIKIMELISKDLGRQLYYGGYDETKKMIYRLIDSRDYEFEFESHQIVATVEQMTKYVGTHIAVDSISYLFLRADDREIIQKFMDESLIKNPERKIYQFSTENGSWRLVGTLKERDPNTLILKNGVLEELMEDLDDFLKSESDYGKYGIPYKKVYLFHGEPGTGKTSLSQIMANRADRSLYILNFDPKMTDDDLSSAIRRIDSTGGILLLEDIDCLFKSRNTNQNLASVSFSSILNNLDGAIQNVGLITIITTNHAELLDPALRRPLRVDRTIKFEKADAHQIHKLFEMYDIKVKKRLLERIVSSAANANMCPAGVSGFLFRNRRKEINDENILELFKSYIEEIKIEEKNDAKDTMYL
jgi:SpoVK/Ycf46/Vps4 family AAA+-type ATPase